MDIEERERLIQMIDFKDDCLIVPSELMQDYTPEQLIQIAWDALHQLQKSMEK